MMAYKRLALMVAGAIAGGGFISTSVPSIVEGASSWVPPCVETRDPNGAGGKTCFIPYGDKVEVCDIQKDGWYAVGFIQWWDDHGIVGSSPDEADGGDQGCDVMDLDIPEGVQVTVWSCIAYPGVDETRYCDWIDVVNAN